MSPSTRSCARDRPRAACIVAALVVALATAAVQAMADRAPPLPDSVLAPAPGLKPQGSGLLTFFGIRPDPKSSRADFRQKLPGMQ